VTVSSVGSSSGSQGRGGESIYYYKAEVADLLDSEFRQFSYI
jgi:hypothetical protein